MDLTIRGGLGGSETLKHLLQIDPGVRVILSSGYGQDPVMQNYEFYGFKGALIKPFFIDQLKEVLSGVVQPR
jgi:two-component system cell cycle sensor histidine kinase/response regulator CckA